jgi:outer membrane protein OmpA-like peptidoglycan-associated protein
LGLRRRAALWLVAFVAFAAGCITRPPPKPPSYAVLLDNLDGSTGAITVNTPKGQFLVTRSRMGASLDGVGGACIFDTSQIEEDFGAAIASRPVPPVTFVLYFDGTGTTLTAESQALIAKILAAVAGRPVPDVSITGHTDTVGGAEANEKLGLARAQLIAQLITVAGLKVAELTVDSHGEFNLLVKTPDETPEPRNRRVEVTIR